MAKYRKGRVEGVLQELIGRANRAKLTPIELCFLAINFCMSVGESLEEESFPDEKASMSAFARRPTCGMAIICGAHAMGRTVSLLLEGRQDDLEWEKALPGIAMEIGGASAREAFLPSEGDVRR